MTTGIEAFNHYHNNTYIWATPAKNRHYVFCKNLEYKIIASPIICKGWGLSAKLGKHGAIWGKLGTALQAYTLNPCTKFPPNPTSRKVNT